MAGGLYFDCTELVTNLGLLNKVPYGVNGQVGTLAALTIKTGRTSIELPLPMKLGTGFSNLLSALCRTVQ